jgi:N-acetylglucosaminyldiphosphoundecaprenol N-acetyl-beta-D-mannosaminyltransferase
MDRLDRDEGRAFFLGSTQETLDRISERTARDYTGIDFSTYSPPFKAEFSEAENQEMTSQVNEFKPDVLFVGMTCPKQEKWAIKHVKELNAGLVVCIGNVFDWYAGTQKAIHPFWFKIKLGWLVRIFLRPEVFKRNIGNQMKFFWHVILMFLKLKKYD